MTMHWSTRQTIIGKARSISSQSFKPASAIARKMDRNILPIVSISSAGYSVYAPSITLRTTTATSIAPMYAGKVRSVSAVSHTLT